mmetsp:Transcript_26431/g.52061  ORF Transcript_26431/g.52061 Transcript_26431/m.52061 type:complete len:221 (-) Transcript_26431:1352-2014(-)
MPAWQGPSRDKLVTQKPGGCCKPTWLTPVRSWPSACVCSSVGVSAPRLAKDRRGSTGIGCRSTRNKTREKNRSRSLKRQRRGSCTSRRYGVYCLLSGLWRSLGWRCCCPCTCPGVVSGSAGGCCHVAQSRCWRTPTGRTCPPLWLFTPVRCCWPSAVLAARSSAPIAAPRCPLGRGALPRPTTLAPKGAPVSALLCESCALSRLRLSSAAAPSRLSWRCC